MKAILTYHSIDDTDSPISVTAAQLGRHMAGLARAGVALVAEDAVEAAEGPAAAITFDDGFVNFAEAAWPVLRDAGAPVTLFVATGRAGGSNDWPGNGRGIPKLPLLDWTALARLAEEGVTLGAHSRTHPDLRRLGADRLTDEVVGCADRVEQETGRRPDAFAYPFGAWDAGVVAAVRSAYRRAYTTELRALGPDDDPHRLPRLDAYYLRGSELDAWGSPRFVRYLAARRAARGLRQLMTEGIWR